MSVKCEHCKGTRVEPGEANCTWCDSTGASCGLAAIRTIGGVPRELVQRIAKYIDDGLHLSREERDLLDELRALLDAPAMPIPSCIGDLERFESDGEDFVKVSDVIDMLGNLKAAQPQGASIEVIALGIQVEKLLCEALGREWAATGISIESLVSELKVRAGAGAQPQGEPVAWVECSPAWLKAGGDCANAPRLCVGRGGISHLHPAHAEQPAPVAVNRPAHALPPPGTEPSGTHHDNDGLDEMRKPVCCGSCPSGCVIQASSDAGKARDV